MYEFAVERLIAAAPGKIWSILTDSSRLGSGPFGIVRIEGDIALGRSIKLWSAVSPKRAFPLKVATIDTDRSMTWRGGMPFGLFTGTRTFTLEPKGVTTVFRMREVYEGHMTPLIWKSMPDLNPSFHQFATALAAEAEA